MKDLTAALLLFLASFGAWADWTYHFMGYRCDVVRDVLIVYYDSEANELGEARLAKKHPNEWEPSQLIVREGEEGEVVGNKTVQGSCKLRHGTYNLRFGPIAGNHNFTRRCGAFYAGWVEVTRNGSTVLPRYALEESKLCGATMDMLTTEIVFAQGKLPVFTTTPQ